MHYVRKLGFEEAPDYDFLRELFSKVLKNIGEIEDGVFDWMLLNGGKGFEAGQVSNVYYFVPKPPTKRVGMYTAVSQHIAYRTPGAPDTRPRSRTPSVKTAPGSSVSCVKHGARTVPCCRQDGSESDPAGRFSRRFTRTHQCTASCAQQPTGKPTPRRPGTGARQCPGVATPVCVGHEQPERRVAQHRLWRVFARAVQRHGPAQQWARELADHA